MIYIAELLGYGDNLITGAILERDGVSLNDIRVVGTSITQKVWKLLKNPIEPDVILFDDMPAMFRLKAKGIISGYRDAAIFRNWARRTLSKDDVVIFEKKAGLRTKWLVGNAGCEIIEVDARTNVYDDRARVIAGMAGQYVWPDAEVMKHAAKEILINPGSRQKNRCISEKTLDIILETAINTDVKISLIDIHGNLTRYEKLVHRYIYNPTLEDAVALLRDVDGYIGPDSFFMHLAYYYKIPQFAIFFKNHVYFQPPGLMNSGGIFYFEDLLNADQLKLKLLNFMLGKTSETKFS